MKMWVKVLHTICNMGTCGLPGMYTLGPWGVHIRQTTCAHVTNTKCNTFTPQIKGICCGLNVMYHIPQLSRCVTTSLVCYNFHYNYTTTSNGMLQKYQGALIQIPKTPLLIKHNISDINCWFELRC